MNDLSISNSLADLAFRIRREHQAAIEATKRTLEHCIAAGALLIDAKAQLKHGEWMPWLADHCSIPDRTVRLYMRLARNKSKLDPIMATVADFTVRSAVALLTNAEDERPPLAEGEIELPIDAVKFRPDLYARSPKFGRRIGWRRGSGVALRRVSKRVAGDRDQPASRDHRRLVPLGSAPASRPLDHSGPRYRSAGRSRTSEIGNTPECHAWAAIPN